MPPRWTQVTQSEFPWERDALAHLQTGLPDRDPYRAWANFEFMLDGAIGEVDALVIAPKGIFLIEIKSWPGRLEGDAGTWQLTRPGDVRPRSLDNPLLLTNRKAKRLKSLLTRQKALRGVRIPFIAPLVFLSHPELDCRLDPSARTGIHGLDGDQSAQRGGLSSVVAAIMHFTAEEHARLANRKVDRPTSTKLAQALEEAGVRPSQRRRQVGDLALGELLDEGPGYQDFDAQHPRFERAHRRVRLYGASALASQEEREQLSRAAEREFELLDAVSHPGIIRVLNWHDHELGPALVFERDPSEIRLDHFLAERADALGIEQRLEMVRQLAEAVAHAHGRRLFHRALSPRSILVVRPDTPDQRFSILNWQAGLRDSGDTLSSSVHGTRDVEQLLDEEASAYLAPEALQPGVDPELLDVFSLGAIAFHVFAGQPAASSYAALVSTLERDGCLEVASALDGAGPNLVELIRQATAADARSRLASVSDMLELLDYLEDEITAPDEPAAQEPETKLADVGRGSQLAGFEVDRRLGRGSTAIAFLVTDADESRKVLKVASDPDRNDRIRDEGEVLAKLDDPTIVSVHGPPVDVNGHAAIVLTYASEGTLASRLQREGRLGLETLERWGADLLGAVSYLERVGIAHRDIKPENLGIIEHPGNRRRHLVLMDFSLSRAPTDQVLAGTPYYIDPFLGTKERPRWDLAAERYAAAVVLHEMATGSPPRWPANARVIDDEVTINRDAFPREVAAPLGDLLARALRRDAQGRFDTAEEMLAAWRRIFEQLDSKPVTVDERDQDPPSLRAAATLETPLAAIGLSARATNALERINAQLLSVEDFIAYPIFRLNRLRGVGMETRDELREAYHDLRNRLGTQELPQDLKPEAERRSLTEVVGDLVPARSARNETEVRALRLLLELDPLELPAGPWPSQTDVATALDVTRGRIGQLLATARQRWVKQAGLNQLREELLAQLQQLGGIAAAEELESAVAGWRGQGEEEVSSLARAAVRAAIETELAAPAARIQQRRAGKRVLLADVRDEESDGAAALAWAVRIGERADELGGSPTLPSSAEVLERLRALRPPAPLAQPAQERLVQLAAAASSSTAASTRLELYPRGMEAQRALTLARSALLGLDRLSVSEMRQRVTARFPEAEPLPDRPALDVLLAAVGLDLEWDEQEHAYFSPSRQALTGVTSYESSLNRLATSNVTTLPPRTEPDLAEAQAFEQRLSATLSDGGLLTLMADPGEIDSATRELNRLGADPVDVDALMLRQLHHVADDRNVRWDLVLQADAADRSTRDWQRLTTLVEMAMPSVEEELCESEGTPLLVNLGLLARYDQLALIDRLRARAMGGDRLHGCWILVPADDQAELPMIDNKPIPVLTPNEWDRVPRPWLRNVHRARRAGEGAA